MRVAHGHLMTQHIGGRLPALNPSTGQSLTQPCTVRPLLDGRELYPDADTVCRTPTTHESVHTHHQTIQQAHHPKSLDHPQDSLLACNCQLGWSCVGCLIVQMVTSADTARAGMPTFVPGVARAHILPQTVGSKAQRPAAKLCSLAHRAHQQTALLPRRGQKYTALTMRAVDSYVMFAPIFMLIIYHIPPAHGDHIYPPLNMLYILLATHLLRLHPLTCLHSYIHECTYAHTHTHMLLVQACPPVQPLTMHACRSCSDSQLHRYAVNA